MSTWTRRLSQTAATCAVALLALASAQSPSRAAGDAAATRPDYSRRSAPTGRPQAPAPEEVPLPKGLVVVGKDQASSGAAAEAAGATAPDGGQPAGQKAATPSRRRPPASPDMDSRLRRLDQQAWAAGRDAAAEAWRRRGMREYYRAGFVEGEREAIGRAGLGAWDYELGLRDGLRDPVARSAGAARGGSDAARRAEADAADAVAEAFHDLRHSPPSERTSPAPRYAGGPAPYPAPELPEVFEALGAPPAVRLAELRGWRPDPWWLYRQSAWDRVLDRGWSDPDQVFGAWLERRAASRPYRSLGSRGDRSRFAAVFRRAVNDYIAERLPGLAARVYRAGWRDGWGFGRMVNIEWSYRRGLREGLVRAHRLAAGAAFTAAYPLAFSAAWRAQWEQWDGAARIEVEDLRAADGDGDGVFSPGEALRLDCTVANFGGRAGSGEMVLDASPFAAGGRREVRIPARSRQQIVGCFETALGAGLLARTEARLRVELAGTTLERPLRVSFPLELDAGAAWGEVRIVEGEGELLVPVHNRSLRAAEGELILLDASGAEITRSAAEDCAPQGRRTMSVTLAGLDPLDLLAGQVGLEIRLISGGRLFDRRPLQLPGLALDLERMEFVEYLLSLAARGGDPERFTALKGLVEQRLRRDWAIAVSRRGNPYRDDYREDGSSTALGQLVQARRTLPGRSPGADLFAELGQSALDLSGDLPGWHPLLRKYLRRLARRLR